MWKHKESKWLVRGGRKVRCYLCGKKILAKGDLFLFHGDTGYYSHQSCQAESTTISGNERRKAVKKIAVGAAVVGAIAAGAGKFLDVSSQSKNSPAAQTILTSQGLILPALTSDPANPVPGQMWYRSDAGVMAHFDAIENRVIYSNRIVNGSAVVTSKGIVNGLSVLPNDGQDWGPDTTKGATSPGQYGGTYTETVGIQEAYDYIISKNGGEIRLTTGIFTLDEPVVMNSPVNVRMTGSVVSNPSANANPTDYLDGTLIVQSASFPTTSSITPTGVAYLFESMPSVSNYGALQIENMAFLGNTIANYGTQGSIGAIASGSGNGYIPRVILNNLKFHNCLYTLDIVNLGGPCYFGNIHMTNCGHGFRLNAIDIDIGLYETFYNTISGIEFGGVFANTYSPTQSWTLNASILNLSVASGGEAINIGYTAKPSSQETANLWAGQMNIGTLIAIPPGSEVPSSFINISGYGAPFLIYIGSLFLNGKYDNFLVSNAQTSTYGTYQSLTIHIDSAILDIFQDLTWYTNNNSTATPVTIKISKILAMLNGYTISNLASENSVINDLDIAKYISPTTPSVPTSATAQQNTNPYAVNVYLYGGDVTEIQITRNGTAYTVFSVSTAIAMSGQSYRLNPGDSITVTYSTAQTWEWLSD